MSDATEQTEQTTTAPAEGAPASTGEGTSPASTGSEGATQTSTTQTIAGTQPGPGAEQESQPKGDQGGEEKSDYWPKDWREQVAKHHSAGNEKEYKKELRRLERIRDPAAIFGMYRDAESKISSNRAIFKPADDASEEDLKAYHQALGAPETAEDYLKDARMPNGAELGEQDRQIAENFAQEMHKVGAPQAVMDKALDWYFTHQEEVAAKQDEFDDRTRWEAEAELKEEYGASYKRQVGAIASLFAQAPGGSDVENPDSLYARLVGGRTADGVLIGDDPDMVRFFSQVAIDMNPAAMVLPDGFGSDGSGIDDEIRKIEQIMRTDRRDYNKNHADRYQELLSARERMKTKPR